VGFDRLLITCHYHIEEFVFYTDLDSIHFELKPEQVYKFYVSVNDTAYALTVIKGIKPSYTGLHFDTKSKAVFK
jgi:hypothetical protein